MALLAVAWKAPRVATPGQRIEGDLEISPADSGPVAVSRIRVIAERTTGWNVPSSDFAIRPHEQNGLRRELWRAVFDPGLVTTPRRFPIDFTIPADTVITHGGFWMVGGMVRVMIHVVGSGFDETYTQPIAIMPSIVPAGAPGTARSASGIEIGVASTVVAHDTTLVGTVSGAPRIMVALVAKLHLDGAMTVRSNHECVAWSERVVVPDSSEHAGVPFAIPIAPELCPSVVAPTHSVSWVLRAQANPRFGLGSGVPVDLPIEIVLGRVEAAAVPPSIGAPHVEPMFARYAAEHGWQLDGGIDAHDPQLGLLLPAISREEEAQRLAVAYAYRGARTFLVSRITHAPLDLGLDVVPSSRLRELFSHDLQAGVAEWDRSYHADARDSGPAEALLRAIIPELPSALGAIVRWNDHELVCERAVADVTPAQLDEVAEAVRALATKLGAHRRRVSSDGPYR